MAFRFNFQNSDDDINDEKQPDEPDPKKRCQDDLSLQCAQEVPPQNAATDVEFAPHILAEKLLLYRGCVKPVQGALAEATADSDLVSGVYEGGFKLWECAVDLCEYMLDEMHCNEEPPPLQGCRVIELGCGHGLPGIVALKAGATVDFCDFNAEVLSSLTMPNVKENIKDSKDSSIGGAARYFSGDWSTLPSVLGEECKYDWILTSDTLYSPESVKSLSAVLGQLLKPDGYALVAAKTYYFGVGGGTEMFQELVQSQNLKVEVAKTYQDGSTNVREMLKVSFDRDKSV